MVAATIGKVCMDYLIDIIESEIQALHAKEIRLRRNLRELEAELAIEGDSIYTRIDSILYEYGIL